jgi:polyhydroxybutyrate depolymerase
VAAVGIVDAIDAGMLDPCGVERPVPIMAFFGTADPLDSAKYPPWFQGLIGVSLELERPLPSDAIDLWLESWALRNGCSPIPDFSPFAERVREVRYSSCQGSADVVLYWIDGQGHSWPGGPALPFLGDAVSGVNASEQFWAFFEGHPRR